MSGKICIGLVGTSRVEVVAFSGCVPPHVSRNGISMSCNDDRPKLDARGVALGESGG